VAEQCGSHLARALSAYVAAELTAPLDAETRIDAYERAIDHARHVRAGFLEGIAPVGLASAQLAAGHTGAALQTYGALIEYWMRTGSWTQQWTTLRNAAEALALVGDHRTPLALLAAGAHAPSASALAPEASERLQAVMDTCRQYLAPEEARKIVSDAISATGPHMAALALAAINRAI
jgi:hypothetical protein